MIKVFIRVASGEDVPTARQLLEMSNGKVTPFAKSPKLCLAGFVRCEYDREALRANIGLINEQAGQQVLELIS